MTLGTLEQLRSYNQRNQTGSAAGLREVAAHQGAILRRAVHDSWPPAPAPAPRRITIRELNQQLSRLPLGPRDRSRFALRRKDGGIDFLELRNFAALHIAEDLAGAARLYGAEVKECGHCGSPLTNPESRRLGLGPKCRKHYGL